MLEHILLPIASAFDPGLILISAGFDAHRDDPLSDGPLDEDAFAQMACHTRDCARSLGIPVGAVLEGGYDPGALARSAVATMRALNGEGEADWLAAEQIVTPRLAGAVGQFWEL